MIKRKKFRENLKYDYDSSGYPGAPDIVSPER